MVESQSSKLLVVGSTPILRSINARVVQLAEASALEAECWGFKSLLGHQFKKERKMHTKAFNRAESAFELAKIVTFIFWMPVIVLTILAFVLDWLS